MWERVPAVRARRARHSQLATADKRGIGPRCSARRAPAVAAASEGVLPSKLPSVARPTSTRSLSCNCAQVHTRYQAACEAARDGAAAGGGGGAQRLAQSSFSRARDRREGAREAGSGARAPGTQARTSSSRLPETKRGLRTHNKLKLMLHKRGSQKYYMSPLLMAHNSYCLDQWWLA